MFRERSSTANMKSCRRFGSRNKSQDEEKNQPCDPHGSFGPSTLDQRGEDSSSSKSTASTAIAHAFEACLPQTHQIPNQPKPSGVLRPLVWERERERERSFMLTNPFFTYRVWCNLDANNLCTVMSEHSIFQSLLLLLQQLMIMIIMMICSWWWWWWWDSTYQMVGKGWGAHFDCCWNSEDDSQLGHLFH